MSEVLPRLTISHFFTKHKEISIISLFFILNRYAIHLQEIKIIISSQSIHQLYTNGPLTYLKSNESLQH
jgi:hypothetical protein